MFNPPFCQDLFSSMYFYYFNFSQVDVFPIVYVLGFVWLTGPGVDISMVGTSFI